MPKKVLCIIGTGFEEIETIAPIDLMRRAGIEVTLASLTVDRRVQGRCHVRIEADTTLADVDPRSYDLLFIPGGPGVQALRADGRPASFARQFAQSGKGIGAICAAPLVLLDAGLLEGRQYTAHFSTVSELPLANRQERVVTDGGLITSRGAGTALEFGLALVRALAGDQAAQQVAEAIMI
jgi:protein deglycase